MTLRRAVRAVMRRVFPSPDVDDVMRAAVVRHRRYGATIGNNTRIYGQLDGVNPQLISIGRNCVLGVQSAVLTHCPIRGARPVRIGDNVWVGFNAIVLPGVTIGDCAVIGAGAVVTKDVPPGSIAAGCPARVLRQLTTAESESLVAGLNAGKVGLAARPQLISDLV